MEPVALALLSAFGGVTVTALAGLMGVAIQSRREHARWLRDKRYSAYLALLQELDRGDDADLGRVRLVASEIALLGPGWLRTPLGYFIRADTDPRKYDRDKARTDYLSAVQRALHLERKS